MDNRPVCIFDSGFGGLTAFRELKRLMPNENIVFFADTGRVPYGGRPVEQLRTIGAQNIQTVSAYDPKLILAACGTISSTAPDVLAQASIPTFGVLQPAVHALAAMQGAGGIGVIATAASIRSGAYENSLREHGVTRPVLSQGCPKFVNLIETGHVSPEDEGLKEAISEYLAEMKNEHVEALLLGCTHYGLISDAIKAYLGEEVVLVEASRCAAAAVKEYLQANGLEGGNGEELFLTSGDPENFRNSAALFLGKTPERVQYIPPMEI